jgi:hypothetical protein
VPGIARVVYRSGHGENLRDVARRTDDSLGLFGAFFRWSHSSSQGRAAIARMEQVHKLPASYAGSATANRSLLDGLLRPQFLKYM